MTESSGPTTETAANADPRPRFGAALDQTEHLIDAVGTGDLGRPTPCADYDVGRLLAHVIAVLRKLTVVGQGECASAVADPATDVTGAWGEEFRHARADLERVWSADAALERSCALPWATLSGREVLDIYTHEFTVHSWDLAQATGRVNGLDPALAEEALAWFTDNLSADDRGEGGPFGPVVEVGADAGVYDRLAGYVGRVVPHRATADPRPDAT